MSRRELHTPELAAIEVRGMTRSAFILRGALAAGAMYGASAVGPFVKHAFAQGTPAGDIAILNFALGLEELEAAFYAAGLKNANLSGQTKKLATEFGDQETQHRDLLKQTVEALGGKAAAAPQVKFGLSNEQSFLKLVVALEDTGVGAYNGAGPSLTTPDLVAAAGSIVQVEGRHAAAMRMRAGQDPSPAAFDTPLNAAQVQAAIKQATGG
jgi:rubrerythrin